MPKVALFVVTVILMVVCACTGSDTGSIKQEETLKPSHPELIAANMLLRELDYLTAKYEVPRCLLIQAVGAVDEVTIGDQIKPEAAEMGFALVTSTTTKDCVRIRILSFAETADEAVLEVDIIWGPRKGYTAKLTQRGDVYGREIMGQH